jgi:hypothetical protein
MRFTAPLVVEATERVVVGLVKATGVVTAGQAFDARDLLQALRPVHLTLEFNHGGRPPEAGVRHPPNHDQLAPHDSSPTQEVRDDTFA